MTQSDDHGVAPVLPEAVRRRVASYVAAEIRTMQPNKVPPPLRSAMRWRSGAMPRGFAERVIAAVAADDEFRHRIGSQLADGEQAQGHADPIADADADPIAAAALLYLTRPEGWAQRLEAAVALLVTPEDPAAALHEALAQVEDLRTRLALAQERHGSDVAEAKRAGASERAALADSASRLRAQLAAAKDELAAALAERDKSVREAAELQRTVRTLQKQVSQAKDVAGQQRAEQRDARLAANARVKVLLEVLQEGVAGLVSELALPAGSQAPADLVEADAPADPAASRRLHSAADLAEVMAVPRCHLLIDGYNVSKGMWPNSALAQQRERLITALTALQSRTGAEITVVFDGAAVGGVPSVTSRAVRVRFSRGDEKADRLIVRLVAAEPAGRPLVVVSSDAALTSGARNAGARTAASDVLAGLLGAGR